MMSNIYLRELTLQDLNEKLKNLSREIETVENKLTKLKERREVLEKNIKFNKVYKVADLTNLKFI